MSNFGKSFRAFLDADRRFGKPISQYRVSVETGIPETSISWYITENKVPPYDRLEKIANYFGYTAPYFIAELEEYGFQP